VTARLHYGWWIVGAAVAIEFFGIGFRRGRADRGVSLPDRRLRLVADGGGGEHDLRGHHRRAPRARDRRAPLYDRQGAYTLAFALNAVLPCVALAVVVLFVAAPAGTGTCCEASPS